MDELFAKAYKETDSNKYLDLIEEMQRLAGEDLNVLPIMDRNVLLGSRIPDKVLTMAAGSDLRIVAPLSKAQAQ